MSDTADSGPSGPKRARMEILWELCIFCQKDDKAKHMWKKPSSYEQVLSSIHTRGKYGDGIYPERSRQLADMSTSSMKEKGATWHKECYKSATSSTNIARAKARYEKEIASRAGPSYILEEYKQSGSSPILTRRSIEPFDNKVCFFCQKGETNKHNLIKLTTDSAGKKLRKAVEKSQNDIYRVRLSTAINPDDAHAIDVRYHNNCYVKHVTNVLRDDPQYSSMPKTVESELAAEIEFLGEVEKSLKKGKILTMNDLVIKFQGIRESNGVEQSEISKIQMKQILSENIEGIQFSKPARLNESERVTLKQTSDRAIQAFEETQLETDMQNMFNVAKSLRKQMLDVESWRFAGSVRNDDILGKHIPKSLVIFLRWLIQGPSKLTNDDDNVDDQVHSRALTLAQHVMFACLTKKQLSNDKKTLTLQHSNEWPLQLSVGLTVHSTFRSKELIDFLHGLCLSVDYRRVIAVETQLANQAVVSMYENDGGFVPRSFIPSRHIFFAVDNCDFQEDTADGKNTLHGTVMNIYQSISDSDEVANFAFDDKIEDRRLYDLPKTITEIEECNLSNEIKPKCGELNMFPNLSETESANTQELCWLAAAAFGLQSNMEPEMDPETGTGRQLRGPPTWSALNSIVSEPLPLTRIATPPLIAAPAHEFSTLLTVLKQAQKINTVLVGEEHKTVVSLDMGLYKPAQKLLMAKKNDIKNIVLRPGELHIVIAMLRTIGCLIDNSGIDAAWLHADLYGQTTIKQILDGNHVKRGVKAHIVTLLSLFAMDIEAFSKQNPEVVDECRSEFSKFIENCNDLSLQEEMSKGHGVVKEYLKTSNFETMFANFNKEGKLMHQVMLVYMRMVMLMLQFIRAVRNGDWEGHLNALAKFVKYFFAFDKLNYARMTPIYISEMFALQESDPELWREFSSGNWVVNKSQVASCALGADHALEQVNRWMKVAGGIVGITQNQTARTRFFLVAPELARLKAESKQIANLDQKPSSKHYELSNSARNKLYLSAMSLSATLQGFTNPFEYEGDDIVNIVTKAVVPENVQKDLAKIETIGSQKLDDFLESRLKTQRINVWDPMHKVSLNTWKTSLKATKLKVGDQTMELKEDRGLFARMLIVANSRPEISLETTIGTYELSVVPRSLFAADGSMNHCSDKSQLMAILEKQAQQPDLSTDTAALADEPSRIAVVDAMVIVQSLDKPKSVKTCKDLSDHFCRKVTRLFNNYKEVHLIFDRYDVERSLKTETRTRRLGSKPSISYHVTDSSRIENVSMKALLTSTATKDELSVYLSTNLIEYVKDTDKSYVVAYQDKVVSTAGHYEHIASNQEEADTKIILHAAEASRQGATSIDIHSADTDVFILCLGHIDKLPKDTVFITGSGQRRRKIRLDAVCNALGDLKARALIGFHAFSGADVTGSMSGKGKISCWQAFNNADSSVHEAFGKLGHVPLEDSTTNALEQYVCLLYQPGTSIVSLTELRWWMFRRKQAESNKLPPTRAAFLESVGRSQYQCVIWKTAAEPTPTLPLPENHGWRREGGMYVPVMTTLPPAPETLLQLVKCGCSKSVCDTSRCKCKSNNLYCTDLCACGAEHDACKNIFTEYGNDDF